MEPQIEKVIERSKELLMEVVEIEKTRHGNNISLFIVNDLASRSANLIHSITGPKSVYSENLRNGLKYKTSIQQYFAVTGVLQAFHRDLTNGNLVNIRHEIETVVVSEILEQARTLSRTKGVHPATVVIVACAAVEEFLRNWCVEKNISITEKQRSISKFATELRLSGSIQLPVERRIMSWADYRNDAAHGDKWNEITQEIANRVLKEIQDFVLENSTILGN